MILAFSRGRVASLTAPPRAHGAKTSACASKIAAGATMVAPVAAATCDSASSLTSVMISLAPAACSFCAR